MCSILLCQALLEIHRPLARRLDVLPTWAIFPPHIVEVRKVDVDAASSLATSRKMLKDPYVLRGVQEKVTRALLLATRTSLLVASRY